MNNYNYYQNAYMGYPQTQPMQSYGQRPFVNPQGYNQQPQIQQQMAVEIPIADIKFVTTKKEVEDFIVFPNTSVLLIDKNGLAYLKISNANAQPFIREFSFVEKGKEEKPLNTPTTDKTINYEQFIKKDEINDLGLVSAVQYKEDYNKLVESFNSKLKELNNKIGEMANGK